MVSKKPIALTMGEPAGVGAEITLKAWHLRDDKQLPPFFLIDDIDHLAALNTKTPIEVIVHPEQACNVFPHALPVLPCKLITPPVKGVLNAANGKAVIQSIEVAVALALKGEVSGVVTNPIHKESLYGSGFKFPGHTEFLGSLCELKSDPVMMLATQELRTVPLTVHIPVKEISATITRDLIIQKAHIVDQAIRQDFGIENPRIAVAGLNPHAGEGGTIGTEEENLIDGVILDLQKQGLNISGTYPADTMFHAQARSEYDVALCMYHDQALIPLKTLDFYGGVNITLGLPIVRTSPDHGTALDISGQGIANPQSLIQAIKMAGMMAKNRP